MALNFLTGKKSQNNPTESTNVSTADKDSPAAPDQPAVLNEDDELFLRRVTSEAPPPPSDPSNSLQPEQTIIYDDGTEVEVSEAAAQTQLPESTPDELSKDEGPPDDAATTEEGQSEKANKKWFFPGWPPVSMIPASKMPSSSSFSTPNMPSMPSIPAMPSMPSMPSIPSFGSKGKDSGLSEEEEAERERRDLNSILKNLNLSAMNNRVFSLSADSQKLLEQFTQVLRDIINGAPTAYDDLDHLISSRHHQIERLYTQLPPFLQSLIQSLPPKIYGVLTSEVTAAAAAGLAEGSAPKDPSTNQKKSGGKSKMQRYAFPSLRSLVSAQGAVPATLRSIIRFLEMRFPFLVGGANVLMSLAVFLLLFVFWYCHKRGRETRKEREGLEEGMESAAGLAGAEEDPATSTIEEEGKEPADSGVEVEGEKKEPAGVDEAVLQGAEAAKGEGGDVKI
ncbi:MAG: hypothetical protein M1831_000826 [Alyxoria varia]|nr:MAG: hypothetical protein M1831_000826 [Alyxoria varia]